MAKKTNLQPAPHGLKPKILVIDDEDDVVELLKYALKEEFQIITAFDTKQALAMIDTEKPNIIITDIYMPVLNSSDLIKELRKIGSMIPILVISSGKIQNKNIVSAPGISHVLEKPFSIRELKTKIRKVLNDHQSSMKESS